MKAAQQALVDALLGRCEPPAGVVGGERRLAAYRNNLKALSAQALAVPFTRLRDALDEEDFAALAWSFWRSHPPERGDLAQWGGALAGFLVERAGEASGLPDLARLDWALHQAERAADVALDAASLALLGTTPPDALRLVLRPGVALLAQHDGPVLVWRQGWRGQWRSVAAGDAAFMAALQAGDTLADALVKGSDAEADFDFGAWLQAALQNAWLHAASATPPPR
ncbi:DNA-binding domain-containing protein [Pelomonas cellulosilytica]|uniref:DNA-binding domain-containing protein n=1 Tax=Pelomonas cellulosilytica TaxID=2906762 RepID=A0ABS8XYJ5_9BURK|nr:DNA-binding domain-containing protein [Pelomonas sp. P8]MCE4555856.1 DNA-binding domain-containing protein [Pelomonas sp. P8]